MLLAAKAERDSAEEARKRMEVKFCRSDKGLALLKGTRLRQELEKATHEAQEVNARLSEQVQILCFWSWNPSGIL